MKRTIFMMIIVNTLIISTLNSCTKDDSLSDSSIVTPGTPITLNLTTYHWEAEADRLFVSTFMHVVPATNGNYSVKVYLVTNGKDTPINQPVSFLNGSLWATNTQTDVKIHYRGDSQNVAYLSIKVVIE